MSTTKEQQQDDEQTTTTTTAVVEQENVEAWLKTTEEQVKTMPISMKPIAIFKSVFSRKNGTPRQGIIIIVIYFYI